MTLWVAEEDSVIVSGTVCLVELWVVFCLAKGVEIGRVSVAMRLVVVMPHHGRGYERRKS